MRCTDFCNRPTQAPVHPCMQGSDYAGTGSERVVSIIMQGTDSERVVSIIMQGSDYAGTGSERVVSIIMQGADYAATVSYTHLTLPTKLSV